MKLENNSEYCLEYFQFFLRNVINLKFAFNSCGSLVFLQAICIKLARQIQVFFLYFIELWIKIQEKSKHIRNNIRKKNKR